MKQLHGYAFVVLEVLLVHSRNIWLIFAKNVIVWTFSTWVRRRFLSLGYSQGLQIVDPRLRDQPRKRAVEQVSILDRGFNHFLGARNHTNRDWRLREEVLDNSIHNRASIGGGLSLIVNPHSLEVRFEGKEFLLDKSFSDLLLFDRVSFTCFFSLERIWG
jgi:hypothetical protein